MFIQSSALIMKSVQMKNLLFWRVYLSPSIPVCICSDFPNIGPSPHVKNALFFPISWGKIPNSVVIKLFVKSFSNEIKSQTFFKCITCLLFVLIMQAKYNAQDTGTSTVYWVAWFVESGMYWTAIKLQKNESGNCSIWNKFLY